MTAEIEEEINALRRECEWVLKEEVHAVLQELHSVLTEAVNSFPAQIIPGAYHDAVGKPEKYILSNTNGPQQVKYVMMLMGTDICDAELTMKLQKTQGVATMTRIYPDAPWRLQQVQDASNHLLQALSLVSDIDDSTNLTSAQRILQLLNDVTRYMNRGRACLAMPRRKTLDELLQNPSLNCFKPPLAKDVAVSFYVQAQKVVLCAYSISSTTPNKQDISARVQAECTVPWLNDILVLFTLALQLCQQLTDKIAVFAQYEAELQTTLIQAPPAATANLLDLNDDHSNADSNLSNQGSSSLDSSIQELRSALGSHANQGSRGNQASRHSNMPRGNQSLQTLQSTSQSAISRRASGDQTNTGHSNDSSCAHTTGFYGDVARRQHSGQPSKAELMSNVFPPTPAASRVVMDTTTHARQPPQTSSTHINQSNQGAESNFASSHSSKPMQGQGQYNTSGTKPGQNKGNSGNLLDLGMSTEDETPVLMATKL